jgi:hypothetical protein
MREITYAAYSKMETPSRERNATVTVETALEAGFRAA